jgi:glucokinase
LIILVGAGLQLADTVTQQSRSHFLLGGLANSKELIINPTKKYMEESLLPLYRNKVKILLSCLPDMNAGVLGAGALAWNELDRKER